VHLSPLFGGPGERYDYSRPRGHVAYLPRPSSLAPVDKPLFLAIIHNH